MGIEKYGVIHEGRYVSPISIYAEAAVVYA